MEPLAEDPVAALVAAAKLYYEQDLSQAEIAKRLNRSRPTVSRMLAAARERGIVRIEVREPSHRSPALEEALIERLGLEDARVITSDQESSESAVEQLGRAAAEYVQQVIQDGMVVGISNGRSLAAMASFLEPDSSRSVSVVQVIGSIGTDDPTIDGPDIARSLAEAYGATCRYLHVPLIVPDVPMRAALEASRNLGQTLRTGRNADLALMGVGTFEGNDRSPIFNGLLTARDVARIKQSGAVGHICGVHYDRHGRELDIDVNQRTVGIGLDALRRIPTVIAVAGGRTKAAAIVAGVRGGLVKSLITDESAATQMIGMTDGR